VGKVVVFLEIFELAKVGCLQYLDSLFSDLLVGDEGEGGSGSHKSSHVVLVVGSFSEQRKEFVDF